MDAVGDLVQRTLRGETEAFGEVVDRYQDMAFACAYAVLRDRHDAEDAVQDAFIAAYSRLGDLRDPDRFPGWLRRVVLSACSRITRRPRLPRAPTEAAEREENARQYGLSVPASTWLGIPADREAFEIRDLTRRLGISPFDLIRWTREGMPALRRSPYIRWDAEHVARWLAARDVLPEREYSSQDLDVLEVFVIGAVARGEGSPEDARDILACWIGVM